MIGKFDSMKIFVPCIVIALLVSSCNQNEKDQCIDDRIANFGSEICTSGAAVKRYTFQGNTTYAIQPGNCIADGADEILDANCSVLGFVGGFGGLTDINGENYYQNATFQETIWQN